jgi:hypothetical protein
MQKIKKEISQAKLLRSIRKKRLRNSIMLFFGIFLSLSFGLKSNIHCDGSDPNMMESIPISWSDFYHHSDLPIFFFLSILIGVWAYCSKYNSPFICSKCKKMYRDNSSIKCICGGDLKPGKDQH